MWRNGRRKGLKIPRGGPVPVRVRSQAPLTEVSPFWRKYMRPLLCLIFFRSFGSLPPPCCDRTVRNSDAIAPRYSRISPSPIGNRYSGRSRDLSQMRQVVPYRRSLFRRSAMNCLSPYAHFAPYGCRLRQLSRSCCQCSLEDVNCEAKPRSQAPALQARLEAIRKREFGTSATPFFRLALRRRFPLRLCHRRTKSWAPDGASNVNRSKLQSGAFAKKYIIL